MSSTKKNQAKLDLKSRRHTKLNKKPVSAGVHEIGRNTISSQETEQKNEDDVVKMLKAFDLDYKYGPCVGIKRIDRWERAKNLGLDPPPMIKDILLKPTSKKYQESLFEEFRSII